MTPEQMRSASASAARDKSRTRRPAMAPEERFTEVDQDSNSDNSDNDTVTVPSSLRLRDIVTAFECSLCTQTLHDVVTLPCGKSICKGCVPETHHRTEVTYPDIPDRRLGFQCPFEGCQKLHSIGDCSADVILNKLVSSVTNEIAQFPSLSIDKLDEIDEITDDEQASMLGILKSTRPELDCQVCYALFHDPLTTGCGHTFCRPCLYRTVDHSRHCPICRQNLTISPILNSDSCPSNALLTEILDTFWAKEVGSRRETALAEEASRHKEFNMSLFMCTLSFPHMPTFLHIFEPRYKLMIRRAMEGDRTFGMVLPNRWSRGGVDAPFYDLGTLLRITNVEFYPDGRCLLETVGLSRFRVLRHSVCDDYAVAKTERVDDVSLEQEEAIEVSEVTPLGRSAAERLKSYRDRSGDDASGTSSESSRRPAVTLLELEAMPTRDIMTFALDFVERMRSQGAPWLAQQALSIYGDCPENPATFPWWLASVLPVKPREKYRLLSATSVRARLKICSAWILEWENSTW